MPTPLFSPQYIDDLDSQQGEATDATKLLGSEKCGREPGGAKANEPGVCPVAVESRVNGTNSGQKRRPFLLGDSGPLCGGKVQVTFAAKLGNCMQCDFYKIVIKEEDRGLQQAKQIIAKMQ